MSGPEFWQTPMGKRFYEHTLPELVKQLGRLTDLGERVVQLVEAVGRSARSTGGATEATTPPMPPGEPGYPG
jgi:hypothetical protein